MPGFAHTTGRQVSVAANTHLPGLASLERLNATVTNMRQRCFHPITKSRVFVLLHSALQH